MKRIILVILIIISGLKILADRGNFAYKNSVVKLAAEYEESKSEKEDNKHKERYHEELYYHTFLDYYLFSPVPHSGKSLRHQQPYFRFTEKPNTPPPNCI